MSATGAAARGSALRLGYERLFVEEWSPYVGGVLLVLLIAGLMANGLFWGVFGGLRLWGDWLNTALGLGPLLGLPQEPDGPLMHRMSLMNVTLVLGAFSAALLSGQFLVNRPPPLEYLWAALGGSLMGLGATLAGGCTTGGFFTPLLHASPAGWAMAAGLVAGAAAGLRLLLWTLEHMSRGTQAPPALTIPPRVRAAYPWLAAALVIAVAAWAARWHASDDERLAARALIVVSGFAIGFVLHRSRLCFARAFREPLVTGDGQMSKAVLLALALGAPVAAVLFETGRIDPYLAIPPTFWLGSLAGGFAFGVGMVFAGGCASGALWRMGEGHLKLWVAVFFFAWSGSVASALLKKSGLLAAEMTLDLIEATAVGYQAYLPVMVGGWGGSFAVMGAGLLIAYLLVRYNEASGKFTLI